MKKKIFHILLLSIIIIFVGIVLYNIHINSCVFVLKNSIRAEKFNTNRSKIAIYIIKDVNVSCRPFISKYNKLKSEKIDIFFLVDKDYTDIDIENFKNAFNVSNRHKILLINDTFNKAYNACRKNHFLINMLIIINEKGKIEEIRWF